MSADDDPTIRTHAAARAETCPLIEMSIDFDMVQGLGPESGRSTILGAQGERSMPKMDARGLMPTAETHRANRRGRGVDAGCRDMFSDVVVRPFHPPQVELREGNRSHREGRMVRAIADMKGAPSCRGRRSISFTWQGHASGGETPGCRQSVSARGLARAARRLDLRVVNVHRLSIVAGCEETARVQRAASSPDFWPRLLDTSI